MTTLPQDLEGIWTKGEDADMVHVSLWDAGCREGFGGVLSE